MGRWRFFLIAVLISTASLPVHAQTASALSNLMFGDIFPGNSKSVKSTEPNSGHWELTGTGGAEVQVTLQLPSNLIHTDGVTTMPISFAANDGEYNHTTNHTNSSTFFDPNTGFIDKLHASKGVLYVWLGGTVHPANSQPGGSYSCDITLDVAYTGN